jgi:hypothetical protein
MAEIQPLQPRGADKKPNIKLDDCSYPVSVLSMAANVRDVACKLVRDIC